jgi:ribose transport system permease protein
MTNIKGTSEQDPKSPVISDGSTRRVRIPQVAQGLERYGVLLAWIAVAGLFSFLLPDTFPTLSTARLIFGTQTVILFATIGLMFSLAVGEFDLSMGSMVGFGGSMLAVLNGNNDWPAWAAIGVTLIVSFLFGCINAFLAVYIGVQSIIITLGTGTLLAGLTLAVTGGHVVTGMSTSMVDVITKQFLGIPLPFYLAVLLTLVAWFILQQTPLGRRMIFVQENREVARLAGLKVKRIRAGGLIATSTIAGFAGIILAGTNGAANPQAGAYYLLPAFAAAFLGSTAIIPGRFNAIGTFVAVYFLVTGITGLQYLGYAGWPEQVFYGGSLVAAVTISHLVGRHQIKGS